MNSFLHDAIHYYVESVKDNEMWLIIGVTLAAICIIIPLITAHSVAQLSNPEALLKEQPDFEEGHAALLAHEFGCREWLKYHRFRFVWAFRFGDASSVIWAQEGLPSRFFTIERIQGITSFAFCTEFDDTSPVALTTHSRKVVFVLPRPPGLFAQSITHFSVEDTWRIHLDSEAFLILKFGIIAKPPVLPIRESFLKSIQKHAAYIRSLPFWPIRAIYWHLVKRFLMANKTVQQQRLAPLAVGGG